MTRTNLITGFLGSGKTTSILHLLANKDPAEKWAVLVDQHGPFFCRIFIGQQVEN